MKKNNLEHKEAAIIRLTTDAIALDAITLIKKIDNKEEVIILPIPIKLNPKNSLKEIKILLWEGNI